MCDILLFACSLSLAACTNAKYKHELRSSYVWVQNTSAYYLLRVFLLLHLKFGLHATIVSFFPAFSAFSIVLPNFNYSSAIAMPRIISIHAREIPVDLWCFTAKTSPPVLGEFDVLTVPNLFHPFIIIAKLHHVWERKQSVSGGNSFENEEIIRLSLRCWMVWLCAVRMIFCWFVFFFFFFGAWVWHSSAKVLKLSFNEFNKVFPIMQMGTMGNTRTAKWCWVANNYTHMLPNLKYTY